MAGLQDLNQLKRDYQNSWETMIANAGVVQFFRPQDNTTAEYVSKLTAGIVEPRPKKTTSEDLETGRLSMSFGVDWKDKKHLEPWQVREIGTDEFLLFASGINGVHRGARRAYWDCSEFKGKFAPDPYH